VGVDVDAAVAIYWSDTRVGVSQADAESFGLNLGWAMHTRTLDAIWPEGWMNPSFGEQALHYWSQFAAS
jgi:hypothetical protein